jgi:glycosyltransferase involved in cell wall biosynthesis
MNRGPFTTSRKLWIISHFYAEETGTGHSMTRIAEGLAPYYAVNVICGQPNYVRHTLHAPRCDVQNDVTIYRCPATPFNNQNIFIKSLNMLTISMTIFFKTWCLIRRDDLVFFSNLPPIAPFFITLACKIRKSKSILRIDDIYPDTLVAAGVLKQNNILIYLLNTLFGCLYRNLDAIYVLGRDALQMISERVPHGETVVEWIPNSADLEHIYPIEPNSNPLLGKLHLHSKFVIKYAGHMGRTHGIETLLQAAEKLKDIDDIHFLFIGSGPKKKWLVDTVKKQGLTNITILPYLPANERSISMTACNVGIISMRPGMFGVSVPGRIYDLLAAGKPVIVLAEKDSEIGQIVQEEDIGWVVPPDNPDKLVSIILEIKTQPTNVMQMGQRARLAAEKKYSLKQQIDTHRMLLQKVESHR